MYFYVFECSLFLSLICLLFLAFFFDLLDCSLFFFDVFDLSLFCYFTCLIFDEFFFHVFDCSLLFFDLLNVCLVFSYVSDCSLFVL